MAKLIEYITKKVDGSFLDITIPNFDFFKIDLSTTISIRKKIKTEEEEVLDTNFQILINRSEVNKSFQQELSNELKAIFKMSFAKFDWHTNSFMYYTNKYQTLDEKKEILINIFSYLKKFEEKYKIIKDESDIAFNKEKENFESYKDEDFVIKYNKELDTIVVLSLSFMGPDKYKLLSNCSKKVSKFKESGIEEGFFDDLISINSIEKKTCFVIDPSSYIKIKNLIETKKKENEEFLKEQEKIIQQNEDEFDKYHFNEKNVFDFKLNFNNEKKCFEFYCRGYVDPVFNIGGYDQQRGILSQWAIDCIYSEYLPEEERENALGKTHDNHNDISVPYHYKILLDYQKDNSVKEKILYVPADNIERIKKIYNNFSEQNKIFNRPLKSIKLNNLEGLSYRTPGGVNIEKFPVIYIDQKNNILFAFKYLNKVPREDKKTSEIIPGSLTLRGVTISYKEMEEFFENHPMADMLKRNSVFLNSEARLNSNDKQKVQFTEKEREEVWDSIYMHAKLSYELERDKALNKPKKKSLKI